MDFRIADTFQASLAELSSDEQKAVKTTAFDLQMNPANPGMKFHRLDRAKDKRFWSVRVSRDIRLIVHQDDSSLMACYVGHHDDAYRWAERRKLESHPTTGAAQIVEVKETIREIEVPVYVPGAAPTKPPLFPNVENEELLGYGVPEVWIDEVRAATEDTILDLAERLPAEAAEALLELATGKTPAALFKASPGSDPYAHPDALRRFRIMTSVDELSLALDFPWDKWTVFLHPAQRDIVDHQFNGPARVSGSAGTGKTVVAMHRAVHLARTNPSKKVLLTTFSDTLAAALRVKLLRLTGTDNAVFDRITVAAIEKVGLDLFETEFGRARIADPSLLRSLLDKASDEGEQHKFSERFLETEWRDVVDDWQLSSWDEYRDVQRLGRKTGLAEHSRATLWAIFERVQERLSDGGFVTVSGVFSRVTESLAEGGAKPFAFVVVDEAQDISVPQLRFLAAVAGDRPDGLFFAGDLGQRIFQTPFSWRSLGVDVRGRSRTLRINYRTSHQIRRQADRLLPHEMSDVDGNSESRMGTTSAFNGAEPQVRTVESMKIESETIAEWLRARLAEGVLPEETAIFVRSESQLDRAVLALDAAGLGHSVMDGHSSGSGNEVAIGTMALAKGLEFRAVVVAACDDEVIPLQSRIEDIADDADLQDVYETERHLLYVACTRARDHLLVTGVKPASEFLDDLGGPLGN